MMVLKLVQAWGGRPTGGLAQTPSFPLEFFSLPLFLGGYFTEKAEAPWQPSASSQALDNSYHNLM